MPNPSRPASSPRSGRRPPVRRKRRAGPETPLTRARIVAAALALVDREGLGGLSMRRLGAELGVDPMAVYHHLPNKEALLDAIVEAVMGEIDLALDRPSDPPEERILRCARVYRDVLLAHAHALPVVLARAPSTPVAIRPVELLVGVLRSAGLGPAQALAGMNTIAAAVRGAAGMIAAQVAGASVPGPQPGGRLAAIDPEAFPYLHEAVHGARDGFEGEFEFGIRALARGLLAES